MNYNLIPVVVVNKVHISFCRYNNITWYSIVASKPHPLSLLHCSFKHVVIHYFNWGNALLLMNIIKRAMSIKHHDIHIMICILSESDKASYLLSNPLPPSSSALPKNSPTFPPLKNVLVVDIKVSYPQDWPSWKHAERAGLSV